MFDTMTFTKIVGGFCGALLIFLLGSWVGEFIYHSGGGHGDGHEQAYVIDTGEEDGGGSEGEGPSFAELFVNADPGKGERVFNKCKACHKVEDGANGTGPYLYGVVGRDVAAADGFSYSGSLAPAADVWTPENLSHFLENPSGFAPGTTMGFAGLKKPEDRANVIAYLDQTDGDTYEMDLPEAEEESASAEGASEEAAADEGAEDTAEETAEEPADEDGAEEEASDDAASGTTAEETASDEAAEEGGEDMAAAEEEAGNADAADEGAGGEESEFAAMVAAADPADGEKVYRKCRACHVVDEEQNRVGPHLVDLVGRPVGSAEGFNYSDAIKDIGGNWTVDQLNAYLEDPRGFAPGNRMSFAGLRKEEDRASVIAYIQSVSN